MKNLLSGVILLALGACASVPPPRPAPPKPIITQSFTVEQYELLVIEYTSPTTVDAIDGNGPAHKIFDCGHAGVAAMAQQPQFTKGQKAYSFSCVPIIFKGPIPHGAVAVERAAKNAHVLFWVSEAFDYDEHGGYLKGNQPMGPFPSADACLSQSKADVRDAYLRGAVASTDTLLDYCMPIMAYGQQSDGSSKVDFHIVPYLAPCPWFPSPGEGACQIEVKREMTL